MSEILDCDVCVIGAGYAGFSAALKASRLGMKTVLIEKNKGWGGTPFDAGHNSLCGLYPMNNGSCEETLNPGISREISEILKRKYDAKIKKMGKVYVLRYHVSDLEKIFLEEIEKLENLRCFFQYELIAVDTPKGQIKNLRIQSKNKQVNLACRAVIDASGSGSVIRLSGASYSMQEAKHRQLAAFSFKLKDIEGDAESNQLKLLYTLRKKVEEGVLLPHFAFGAWLQDTQNAHGVFRMSVLPSDFAYDMIEVKKQACRLHQIFKEDILEFSKSEIEFCSQSVVEREGLRLSGKYTLTKNEMLNGKSFESVAFKASWPIEFWDQKRGPQYTYLAHSDFFEVPKGCLVSKDIENLFVAGRCLSVDAKVLASVRVTGNCLDSGEASADLAKEYLNLKGSLN